MPYYFMLKPEDNNYDPECVYTDAELRDINESDIVKMIKDWTLKNFLFTANKCSYNSYNDVKEIGDLPEYLDYEGYDKVKSHFKTPYTHLITTLLNIGLILHTKYEEFAFSEYGDAGDSLKEG